MPRTRLFDPFGDFDTAGYLQNAKGYKTASAVKRFEHSMHAAALPAAIAALQKRKRLAYKDILDTHRRLFGEVYPTWAGKDRLTTLPDRNIHKGSVTFAPPTDIFRAADYALKEGGDPSAMRDHPGEIMGYLAYAHPFLEGNGRTILVVHGELARRAEISIDWRAMPHRDYLAALTRELAHPNQGLLDAVMQPFVVPNPDQLVLAHHQPIIQPPPSGARTISSRDPVVRGKPDDS